ncbi:MAG TPA: hypothetical protein VFY61_18015, partial [Pyrinomonadaceae bacterium]|nr:hypothetical protein [Pyrinomonadaceae bacterium]
FVSQPVRIESDKPTWALLFIALTPTSASLEISQHVLLRDGPNVPTLSLGSAQGLVPQEFSINDPSSIAACQSWIQNRRSKFGTPRTPRTGDRRSKTVNEQANDLLASIVRLRQLREQTLAGNSHFLGTLAGEMRASVYWPKGRETQPDHNWNPLLLRMASLADLPLPVYSVTPQPEPPVIKEAIMHMTLSHAPRIERMFTTDQISDLQESLLTTVLRLGPSPGRVISALELIKELAHTMGAAHYDEDASSFLDVLHGMKATEGDQATILICQIADTLASLSEWVFSELKNRKLIG